MRARARPRRRAACLHHHYKVDENGKITWANLVIATGQNNKAMNLGVLQAAKHYVKDGKFTEGILNRVEAVVRTFDPCLSCSTHAFGQMPLAITLNLSPGRRTRPGGARLIFLGAKVLVKQMNDSHANVMEPTKTENHKGDKLSSDLAKPMQFEKANCLVLACGNTLRSDDGVGPGSPSGPRNDSGTTPTFAWSRASNGRPTSRKTSPMPNPCSLSILRLIPFPAE